MLGLLWEGVPSDATKNFSRLFAARCLFPSPIYTSKVWSMAGNADCWDFTSCPTLYSSLGLLAARFGYAISKLFTRQQNLYCSHWAKASLRAYNCERHDSYWGCLANLERLLNLSVEDSLPKSLQLKLSLKRRTKIDGGGGMSLIFSRRGGGNEDFESPELLPG